MNFISRSRALFILFVFSAGAGAKHFDCEVLRQIVSENLFNSYTRKAVSRDLETYLGVFGKAFREEILSSEQQHFLDMGAGSGVFAKELAGVFTPSRGYHALLGQNVKPLHNVTAVSFAVDKGVYVDAAPNFEFKVGQFFEEIPSAELTHRFGQVTVATDLWGVLAYSDRPDAALRKLLEVGPRVKLFLMVSSGRSHLYASRVYSKGKWISFPEWLKGIPGLSYKTLKDSEAEALVIEFSKGIKIPRLMLHSVPVTPFMPPARNFFEL